MTQPRPHRGTCPKKGWPYAEQPFAEIICTAGDQRAREWGAVLSAPGIGHRLRREAGGWVFEVPSHRAGEARAALEEYDQESTRWPPRPRERPPPPPRYTTWAGLWGSAMLVLSKTCPENSKQRRLRAARIVGPSASRSRMLTRSRCF